MGLSFERFKADSHSTLNIELSTPGQDFRCCDKWNYKKVALIRRSVTRIKMSEEIG